MAVRECATFDILPGDPDVHALCQDRRERELFGVAPIDCRLGAERFASPLKLLG